VSGSLRLPTDVRVRGFGLSLLLALVPAMATPAFSGGYKIIHDFTYSKGDGGLPLPELSVDTSGRLYGTTEGGGQFGDGTIFRLTPPVQGSKKWTEEILHSFSSTEDNKPSGGVLIGPSGELYGTTQIGGAHASGSVYRLDGTTLTTLHEFNAQNNDGYYPLAGLVFGADGLLYGTTERGPAPDGGTVFSISPQGDGVEYAILHNFGNGADGYYPYYGRLLADKKGDLVGTTYQGGANTYGAIFQVVPPAAGKTKWKEKLLYTFGAYGSGDAGLPLQGVARGVGGVFYGCAQNGTQREGAVYALTPPPKGSKTWSESVIYDFAPDGGPAATICAVTTNSSGSLFGVTDGGGANGQGTFFELDPPARDGAAWTVQVLHSFGPTSSTDGLQPASAPLQIGKHFYGTTQYGGSDSSCYAGCGTVYEITP